MPTQEVLNQAKRQCQVNSVTCPDTGKQIERGAGYLAAHEVSVPLTKRLINIARGGGDEKHVMPDDVAYFTRTMKNGPDVTEPFCFETDTYTILVIPTELRFLIRTKWFCDGTFRHCDQLFRDVDGEKVNFHQTYIIR